MENFHKPLKSFDFLADSLPFGYAYNFDNYLFNKIKHIKTQGIEERADYFIVNNVRKRLEGKIHFLLRDNIAYSPYKSLFGSFEFNRNLHPNLIAEFWQFIEGDLRRRSIKTVKIISFAECYMPRKAAVIHEVLTNSGFKITRRAINHHIPVNEAPLQDRMHPMEVRRLNKCVRSGFVFRQENTGKAMEIYEYIARCRREQGLEVSISEEKFRSYIDEFPQNYPAFSVRRGEEIMAATICIVPHRLALYNFLPGSLRQYKTYSPTVMLISGLYDYCRDRKTDLLDLGISTEEDGTDQESLIAFKERMGAERSYKYFYEKNI